MAFLQVLQEPHDAVVRAGAAVLHAVARGASVQDGREALDLEGLDLGLVDPLVQNANRHAAAVLEGHGRGLHELVELRHGRLAVAAPAGLDNQEFGRGALEVVHPTKHRS